MAEDSLWTNLAGRLWSKRWANCYHGLILRDHWFNNAKHIRFSGLALVWETPKQFFSKRKWRSIARPPTSNWSVMTFLWVKWCHRRTSFSHFFITRSKWKWLSRGGWRLHVGWGSFPYVFLSWCGGFTMFFMYVYLSLTRRPMPALFTDNCFILRTRCRSSCG